MKAPVTLDLRRARRFHEALERESGDLRLAIEAGGTPWGELRTFLREADVLYRYLTSEGPTALVIDGDGAPSGPLSAGREGEGRAPTPRELAALVAQTIDAVLTRESIESEIATLAVQAQDFWALRDRVRLAPTTERLLDDRIDRAVRAAVEDQVRKTEDRFLEEALERSKLLERRFRSLYWVTTLLVFTVALGLAWILYQGYAASEERLRSDFDRRQQQVEGLSERVTNTNGQLDAMKKNIERIQRDTHHATTAAGQVKTEVEALRSSLSALGDVPTKVSANAQAVKAFTDAIKRAVATPGTKTSDRQALLAFEQRLKEISTVQASVATLEEEREKVRTDLVAEARTRSAQIGSIVEALGLSKRIAPGDTLPTEELRDALERRIRDTGPSADRMTKLEERLGTLETRGVIVEKALGVTGSVDADAARAAAVEVIERELKAPCGCATEPAPAPDRTPGKAPGHTEGSGPPLRAGAG